MAGYLRVWDVEHGACSMLWSDASGALAMIDCGHNASQADPWRPSSYLKNQVRRNSLEYLIVTNADRDHLTDIARFQAEGVTIQTLTRNRSPSNEKLREIKELSGTLSPDLERYLEMDRTYTGPVTTPFNEGMGGWQLKTFAHAYPRFQDTNNLSLAAFLTYDGVKFLFPGDTEKAGWLAHLENPQFVAELSTTNILLAPHHGRQSGFCAEIFQHFQPLLVVISDKGKVHTTQEMVPQYNYYSSDRGLFVSTTGRYRHVLTTRRDGHITFTLDAGAIGIETECHG